MLSNPGCHVRDTYIGCIGTHAHCRQVMSLLCLSDVITYNCILAYSGTSRACLKKQWYARKIVHYSCECRIKKCVPQDHRLTSLCKPRDAKQWSLGHIFLSYPHTHDRSLYSHQCPTIEMLFRRLAKSGPILYVSTWHNAPHLRMLDLNGWAKHLSEFTQR